MTEYNLEDLKKDYKKIQEKYDLPSFEDLNKDFQIEKILESETEFLIREIKKYMADKFSNYLKFIEALLNPVNTPMFVFSVIKAIDPEQKKQLTECYKKLAKIEVKIIELDVKFVEEKEAEFIKESYKTWKEIQEVILNMIKVVEKNWDNKSETNGKGYFG